MSSRSRKRSASDSPTNTPLYAHTSAFLRRPSSTAVLVSSLSRISPQPASIVPPASISFSRTSSKHRVFTIRLSAVSHTLPSYYFLYNESDIPIRNAKIQCSNPRSIVLVKRRIKSRGTHLMQRRGLLVAESRVSVVHLACKSICSLEIFSAVHLLIVYETSH
jgi:hypothetical protein